MLAEILSNPVAWPLWAVLVFAATMYPLGFMMPGCACCGSTCIKCMGQPEYLVVEVSGLTAACTPPSDLNAITGATQHLANWGRDASTLNGKYLVRFAPNDYTFAGAYVYRPDNGDVSSNEECVWMTALGGPRHRLGAFLTVTAIPYQFQINPYNLYSVVAGILIEGDAFSFVWAQTSTLNCSFPSTLTASGTAVRLGAPGWPEDREFPPSGPREQTLCAPGSTVVVRDYNPETDTDCIPWRAVEFTDGLGTDPVRRCVNGSYWRSSCIETEQGCVSCAQTSQEVRVYNDNTFPTFPWTPPNLCQTPEVAVRITATIASGPIDEGELDELNSTFSLKWSHQDSAYLWLFPYHPSPGEAQRSTLAIYVLPRANTSEQIFQAHPPFVRCGDGQMTYGVRISTGGDVGFKGDALLWSSCVARQCQSVPNLTITRSGVPWTTVVNGVKVDATVNLTVELVGS